MYSGRPVDPNADGAVKAGVHASYLHTHPAAHPDAITRFVAAAESRFCFDRRNL
jgi:cobyrinic acid a,c-diamide synthase